MYNFYTLNANNKSENSASTSQVSVTVNERLTNDTFYSLFETYYRNSTEENEDALGKHINSIEYLIAILPNDDQVPTSAPTELTITKAEDINFLICTTEDREVFLPAFTDSREITRYYTEPVYTLKVPAMWLWKFVLNQGNLNGIVFNPGTIGWDISLEHIQSLLDDLTTE